MSRLFYDRIVDPNQPKAVGGTGVEFSEYLTKVAKLIPSEIIAGYLSMIGFVGSIRFPQTQIVVTWLAFAVGLVLTPMYLNQVADANKPKRTHLIVSAIAFVVWAYVTTGKQLFSGFSPDLYEPAIGSVLLIAFCLFSAVVPLK